MSYAALMVHFEAAPSEATTCAGSKASYPRHSRTRRVSERPLKHSMNNLKVKTEDAVVVCGGRLIWG